MKNSPHHLLLVNTKEDASHLRAQRPAATSFKITSIGKVPQAPDCSASYKITSIGKVPQAPNCSASYKITSIGKVPQAPNCSASYKITSIGKVPQAPDCSALPRTAILMYCCKIWNVTFTGTQYCKISFTRIKLTHQLNPSVASIEHVSTTCTACLSLGDMLERKIRSRVCTHYR